MTKRLIFGLLVFLLSFSLAASLALAGEKAKENIPFFGLGVSRGEKVPGWSPNSLWGNRDQYGWQSQSAHLLYGWRMSKYNDRWRVWFEGEVGSISFGRGIEYDLRTADILVKTSYDFLRFKDVNLHFMTLEKIDIFAQVGGGIGWGDKKFPDEKLLGRNPHGIFTCGLGVSIPLGENFYAETTFDFYHRSSFPDSKDKGLNGEISCIKIVKYFDKFSDLF